MKSLKNIFYILLISSSSLFQSCEKSDDGLIEDKNSTNESASISQELVYDSVFKKNVDIKFKEFIENNENIDLNHFNSILKSVDNQSQNKSTNISVWGVGLNNSVWKWLPSSLSWYQPNPSASLKYVSVPKDGLNDGVVWGVGTNNTIWKWNGSNWFEPNPNARAHYIAALTERIAFGIGFQGQIVVTVNGGGVWDNFTSSNQFTSIGVGYSSSNPIWAIQVYNGSTPKLYKYDQYNFSWTHQPTPSPPTEVGAVLTNGAYYLDNRVPKRIFYVSQIGGTVTQPNQLSRMYRSISVGDGVMWGIGANNTPIKSTTTILGTTWTTPNPAANLSRVDVGVE